ncbi:MAG: outer membrane beta-barrel protein [Marinilabiliales bacterium]|nr:outer membrane beta-barrel protein [Marinilabiliales bacterium]
MSEEKHIHPITELIRHSLADYEEPYAKGAWEGFVKQRERKKKRLLWQVISGVAACLIFGLIGTGLVWQRTSDEMVLQTKTVANQKPVAVAIQEKPATSASTKELTAMVAQKHAAVSLTQTGHSGSAGKRPLALLQENKDQNSPAVGEIKSSEPQHQPTQSSKEEVNSPQQASAKQQNQGKEPTTERSDAVQPLPERDPNKIHPKRIRIGINIAPGINYTQSANALNLSGGLSADIALTNRIGLTTGLQLENGNVKSRYSSIAASVSAPSNQNEAKRIDLDLPLNLTWRFAAQKEQTFYVSAGVSSLVHLYQENTLTSYSQMLVPVSDFTSGTEVKSYNIVNQVSVLQNSNTPNQTFDFAGRMNLMFGVERKLSNRLWLHLEPYAKIPLSGSDVGYLKYTSTGINFKISF